MTFRGRHLLGIEALDPVEIGTILDLSEEYVGLNRSQVKHGDALKGLPAVSPMAERMGLDRDIALVEMTGVRYHADQITTRRALPALERSDLRSKSHNTPFDGQKMQGRVLQTWVGGKKVFDRNQ